MEEIFEIINGELIKYNGMDNNITIPKVEVINESAFYLNDTIENVVLSDGVESIKNWAFGYCISLKTIFISATVKEISPNAFDGCIALKKVIVSEENKYFSSENGVLFDKMKKRLMLFPRGARIQNYVVPDSVEEICDNAFNRCCNLENINISENVTSIGYKAFGYCTGLKSIFLSKNIRKIGYCAFASTTSIEHFTVDKENKNFRSIDGVLFDYGGHTLIQFPLGRKVDSFFIAQNVRGIEERAFSDSNLSSIDVDNNNLFFKSVNGCLFSCDLSLLICYPTQKQEALFEIPIGVTKICNSAFKNNKNLESVILPRTIEHIDRHAFECCDNLRIVKSDTSSLKELGWACFSDCRMLENVELSQTELRIIQGHAFFNCPLLKFESSNKIEFIGFDAFGSSEGQKAKI